MKGTWILAGAAIAGGLLLLRAGDDPPVPRSPDLGEDVALSQAPRLDASRSEVPRSEQPPVVVAPECPKPPEDQKVPVAPEPPPQWIDEAWFVEAGLSREQAAELVEGMRLVHRQKLIHDIEAEHAAGVIELQALMMFELGPVLADRIKDGSITFRWTPRLRPWASVAQSFGLDRKPGAEGPWSYTVHGRVGFLNLEIPRRLCDKKLLERVVAADK